jgi:hypothetical protein
MSGGGYVTKAKATANTAAAGYCMKCKAKHPMDNAKPDHDEKWTHGYGRDALGVQQQDVQDRRKLTRRFHENQSHSGSGTGL